MLKGPIRIFTDIVGLVEATTLLEISTGNPQRITTKLAVTPDGSCVHNGTADVRAGSEVWYGREDPRNVTAKVPGKEQLNQISEFLAILLAIIDHRSGVTVWRVTGTPGLSSFDSIISTHIPAFPSFFSLFSSPFAIVT